jgi:osmotically-inducible protein OsmY
MKTHKRVTMIMAAVVILGASGALLANQMNDRIESSAKKTYVFMTYLKADDIKIQAADDSVVTLTGTVSEWPHRSLAEDAVAGLPGVKRVDNKLEVKGEQPAENSDAWIGMKVKSMLLYHRNVSGLKTEVDVKEGVVILHGQASSQAQKELTTEYVKDVEGVKSVKNDMTVAVEKAVEKTEKPAAEKAEKTSAEKTGKTTGEKMSEYIDDASITAQIKSALLFHRSTSALKTKVESKDGIVTVKGAAKNSAEKDLVGKLVNDIKGVKGLKNEMTIEQTSMK